jgi:hypothetical protein
MMKRGAAAAALISTLAVPFLFGTITSSASTSNQVSVKVSSNDPKPGSNYVVTVCWPSSSTKELIQVQQVVDSKQSWQVVWRQSEPPQLNGCSNLTFRTKKSSLSHLDFFRARIGSLATGESHFRRLAKVRVSGK